MSTLLALLDHPLAHRLGWVLLHSLWQGALVAVLFGLLRCALRRASANARHLAGCGCLLLLLATPAATWWFIGTTQVSTSDRGNGVRAAVTSPDNLASGESGQPQADSRPGWFIYRSAEFLERLTPALVAAWLVGVALFSARLLKGYWRLKTLRTEGTGPLDADWTARLNELKRRLKISRPVRLLQSALVEVPTVIGWLRPVILLPASCLTGLTPAQLEAVIAHELAHVCRHDYLVNVFQNVVETLMFYHPAAWWISRCIRDEREHCCDDLVVEVCGNRLVYARALATLEELRGEAPQLAFAASGGSLLDRIRRLLGRPAAEEATWRQTAGLALIGIGLLLVIAGVTMLLVPASYSSVARIKIEHDTPHQIEVSEGQLKFSYDTRSFQTELATIRSPKVLKQVVETLGLADTWGKRYYAGQTLKTDEAVEILKRMTTVQEVRNTSLVDIKVLSPDPAEAAQIANAVAEAYRLHRIQSSLDAASARVGDLTKSWENECKKVEEMQKVVDRLRTELQISDPDPRSTMPTPMITAEVVREYLKTLTSFRTAEAHQQAQLENLRKLDRRKLREVIQSALEQPDSMLGTLFNELDLAEQRRRQFELTLSKSNEVYKTSQQAITELNEKIDKRVDGILAGLQNRLEQTRASIVAINSSFESAKSNDLFMAEYSRPYYASKQQLAELSQFKTVVGNKIAAEKTDLMLPKTSAVTITDQAVPSLEPVAPRRSLAMSLVFSGLLLGILGLVLRRRKAAIPVALKPA